MKITYSDGLGLVEVTVDEFGINCDGTFFFFSDTNERDYKVSVSSVFKIMPD